MKRKAEIVLDFTLSSEDDDYLYAGEGDTMVSFEAFSSSQKPKVQKDQKMKVYEMVKDADFEALEDEESGGVEIENVVLGEFLMFHPDENFKSDDTEQEGNTLKRDWIAKVIQVNRTKGMLKVQWFYRVESTVLANRKQWNDREVFLTYHVDKVPIGSAKKKCEVYFVEDIRYSSLNNLPRDVYYYKFFYDIDLKDFIYASTDECMVSDKLAVCDLFCGCGGLSIGLMHAGFKIKYGIDVWEPALKTYRGYHGDETVVIQDDVMDRLLLLKLVFQDDYPEEIQKHIDEMRSLYKREVFNVDKLLDMRWNPELYQLEFKVKWQGSDEQTWEADWGIPQEKIQIYQSKNKDKYGHIFKKAKKAGWIESEMISKDSGWKEKETGFSLEVANILKIENEKVLIEYKYKPFKEAKWKDIDYIKAHHYDLLTQYYYLPEEVRESLGERIEIDNVQACVDVKVQNGVDLYLVKWEGLPEKYNSWQTRQDVPLDLREMAIAIKRTDPSLPKPDEISLVIGGPPCQGFSMRNKHRGKDNDQRNPMIFAFIQFVEFLQPTHVVMENVPGMLGLDNSTFIRATLKYFLLLGYQTKIRLLCASNYGVPQRRWRVFVFATKIGYRMPETPPPTHKDKTNYARYGIPSLFEANAVVPSKTVNQTLLQALTIADAISDLPDPVSARDKNVNLLYAHGPLNDFQRKLRTLPNGTELEVIYNHVAPSYSTTKRNHIIEKSGRACYRLLEDGSVDPRDINNPPKNTKTEHLIWTDIFRTILGAVHAAHPMVRKFSIREACRAQSFPDGVIFQGNIQEQSQQVGNAVPCILGEHIGLAIKKASLTPNEVPDELLMNAISLISEEAEEDFDHIPERSLSSFESISWESQDFDPNEFDEPDTSDD